MTHLLKQLEKRVFPVVHYSCYAQAYSQGALALQCGADGVFFISHGYEDSKLFEPAGDLKQVFPDKLIGLNLLSSSAERALKYAMQELEEIDRPLDMVWVDSPGVSSEGISQEAQRIAQILHEPAQFNESTGKFVRKPLFFGSVAFKYQKFEPDPGTAAIKAFQCEMIPTTSGIATGSAPGVQKLALMREQLDAYMVGQAIQTRRQPGEMYQAPLAVASGMTCDNVRKFLPYATDFLVATGISKDEHYFDKAKLEAFVCAVKG